MKSTGLVKRSSGQAHSQFGIDVGPMLELIDDDGEAVRVARKRNGIIHGFLRWGDVRNRAVFLSRNGLTPASRGEINSLCESTIELAARFTKAALDFHLALHDAIRHKVLG